MSRRTLVDVSHAIESGMITYPGLPGPVVSDHMSREESAGRYAPGVTFQIGRIEMVTNTGTYVDAPFHRLVEGADIGRLPLERLADVPGIVIEARDRGRAVDEDAFSGTELSGRAVLIRTGWSRHWGTEAYGREHPYLTRGAAERLVAAGPALVGIDTLNIDDTRDGSRPAHTLLLTAGVPIVEHLCNLEALPSEGFRFHCAPAPFRGAGSFPVRAYAILDVALAR